jgi:hypothetical protein
VSDEQMLWERRIAEDREGSGRCLIEVQSRHLLGGNLQNREKVSQDRPRPARDSSQTPPNNNQERFSYTDLLDFNLPV